MKAYVDGEIVSLSSIPELDKDVKHDIKIIVDYVKVSRQKTERLSKSLRTVFDMADGIAEVFLADSKGKIQSEFSKLSVLSGCPKCGFSWPKLDSRYFSSKSRAISL